jgi:hypothetical protein
MAPKKAPSPEGFDKVLTQASKPLLKIIFLSVSTENQYDQAFDKVYKFSLVRYFLACMSLKAVITP